MTVLRVADERDREYERAYAETHPTVAELWRELYPEPLDYLSRTAAERQRDLRLGRRAMRAR